MTLHIDVTDEVLKRLHARAQADGITVDEAVVRAIVNDVSRVGTNATKGSIAGGFDALLGSWDCGGSLDNDQIDRELAVEYGDPHENKA